MSDKWYVVKNDRGARCVSKPGRVGCGKVHEFMSHGCRPVAFKRPWEWEMFRVVSTEDRGRTLKETEHNVFVHPMGEVVQITEKEARDLNCVMDPPPAGLLTARSLPGGPVRRMIGRIGG